MAISLKVLGLESSLEDSEMNVWSLGKELCFGVFRKTLSRLESSLIGDLRSLEGKIAEVRSTSFGVVDLGLLFGRLVIWSPSSRDELAFVLKELETQAQSRSTYQSFAEFLGAKSIYVLSENHEFSLLHRSSVLKFLHSETLASAAWQICLNHLKNLEGAESTFGLEKSVNFVVFQVFAREVLGMDERNLVDKAPDILSMIQHLKNLAIIPDPLLSWIPTIKSQKEKFRKLLENLLDVEVNRLHNAFQKDPSECPKGLLAKAIWDKLESDVDLQSLKFDEELRSIVMVLFALENFCSGAEFLQNFVNLSRFGIEQNQRLIDLKSEIIASKALDLNSKNLNLGELNSPNHTPLLQAFMQKILQNAFDGKSIILRNVEKEIQVGSWIVPKNSKLIIKHAAIDSLGGISPFGMGNRICPGRHVAQLMLKVLTVFMLFSEDMRSKSLGKSIPHSQAIVNLDAIESDSE